METMIILGQEKVINRTDFKLRKASDKFGKLLFSTYEQKTRGRNTVSQNDVIEITLIAEDKKTMSIDIEYTGENLQIIEKYEFLKPIDFEDCLVSHRASGNGDFAQIIQTVRANKISVENNINKNQQPQK